MSILHVNDVARIGTVLVEEARAQGLDWELYDIARVDPRWTGPTRSIRRAFRGLRWEMGLAKRAARASMLDVHGATVLRHTGWVPRPYVLHLHGSDIRRFRYEEQYADLVTSAVRNAQDVYYTTPDLAEHVLDIAPTASLQPVVVDLEPIPENSSMGEEPFRVRFASRWGRDKGGDLLTSVLGALRDRFDDLVIEGLRWGEDASRVEREFGVRMHERMTHDRYAEWLGGASVIIGQMTGVMGVSEIEALATGRPVVMPLDERWYDGSHESTREVPVLGGVGRREDFLDLVIDGVERARDGESVPGARAWVDRIHGSHRGVERLLERYLALGKG